MVMKKLFVVVFLVGICLPSFSQRGLQVLDGIMSGAKGGTASKDTSGKLGGLGFEHRDDAKDSINLSYRYLDGIRSYRLDSSVNDFYKYFSIPVQYQYMGNHGSAAYSLIFNPIINAGWDAGFHAFDVYKFTVENTRFYRTTKPFTQLSYQLASGKEQMIKVTHTQSPKPNFNFGFDYRLITAPGFFVTQNTNHNNYRLFSNYQGKRKRYAAYFAIIGNTIRSSENGGIKNDSFLSNPDYKKRFSIPVYLGGDQAYEPNPFKSSVSTGNIYKDAQFFFRHSYDIGKKDSVEINDSTTEYLFYPRLRFQHTISYQTQRYEFRDAVADSVLYHSWYDTVLAKETDSFAVVDSWKILKNNFSIIQFPDMKNQGQYLLLGITHETYKGTFIKGQKSFYNIITHAVYRNKTRNKLWDIHLSGDLYLNGWNSGDYKVDGSLSRFLKGKWGNVQLSFTNVNRTPSFIFNNLSSFNFVNNAPYKKENITVVNATAENAYLTVSATNYLINNYAYFSGLFQTAQYNKLINLLQLSASKKISLTKKWKWYVDVTVQQTDGSAPIRVPLVFTRNRIAYEGVFYKNLNLSTGIEARYYTPYYANNYSPVMGQFSPQDTMRINNLPDISAFFHFRIKSFTGYVRTENLNAMSFSEGFGFTHNNFAAPHYVYPGFIFRFGIQWRFIN